MERVDELTSAPVVGQFYWVQVVNGVWCGKRLWYPVMGDMHEDGKFFQFYQQHYHLDRRFISDKSSASDAVSMPFHNRPVWRRGAGVWQHVVLSEPKVARRKCVRDMLPFPLHFRAVRQMQGALSGAQCQRHETGWVCPHRGLRLGSTEASQGVITCPMHGLQINAETGKVL